MSWCGLKSAKARGQRLIAAGEATEARTLVEHDDRVGLGEVDSDTSSPGAEEVAEDVRVVLLERVDACTATGSASGRERRIRVRGRTTLAVERGRVAVEAEVLHVLAAEEVLEHVERELELRELRAWVSILRV